MPSYVELRSKFRQPDEPQTYFYEVMEDRSVRRKITIVADGSYRWDDVRAHVDPEKTLFGVNSCIEGAFPTDEGWDHSSVAYIHMSADEFEDRWRAAQARGKGPLDCRVDVFPNY